MAAVGRFFLEPRGHYFLFGPRGTGKSTWVRARHENALVVDLLAPEVARAYTARPERLRGVIAYLEGFPLEDLKGPAQCLFWLSLSMAEVAFAVEKYDAVGRVPYAIDLEQMIPLHDF